MKYAAIVRVDNSGEDPETGRRGLREELAPAMRGVPGFVSGMFFTAYERGDGLGIVVLDTRAQAEALAAGFAVGAELRPGVTVTESSVMELSAEA